MVDRRRLSRVLFVASSVIALLMGLTTPAMAPHGPLGAYSVRGDVDDQLYRVDLATGTATAIGATGFGDIEALAFAPNGVLYGVDDVTNQLVTCDVLTGACTAVGPLNQTITDMGLTFDLAGNLWMSVDAPQNFYRIDPATGTATLIGPQGQEVTGLTADGPKIYGLGGDGTNNLVTIDTATGAATPVGPLGTVDVSDGGLDFAPGGTLHGVNDTGQLFTIDPTTGAATLGPTTLTGFENLAILDHAPTAVDDGFSALPGTLLTVSSPGVLANDTDQDGHSLKAELSTGPSKGLLSLNANGGFTYTPNAGFVGIDTFSYRASDGALRSAVTTVELIVGACSRKAATHVGTTGNDVIIGTTENDVIVSLSGRDRVNGGDGNDRICLGGGKDRALGGPGKDRLFGQGHNDRLKGGPGRDFCAGLGGQDKGKSCEKERSIP